jgi:glycosyltransferase involved in cell wall biosynthesis
MVNQAHNIQMTPRVAIILPCFNENESISYAAETLLGILAALIAEEKITQDSYLFFVDDGSQDNSWKIIEALHLKNNTVKGMKLSRNFGHQAALLAGLTAVTGKCDAAISIDADLQQDPLTIRDFVNELRNGADVVLGVRRDRAADGKVKKLTAVGFYRFMAAMGVNAIPNHADYRLLSRRAMEALALYPEPEMFLRVTCLLLGFQVSTVFFDVKARQYGQTKYSLRKMLQLAVHGVTSYSVTPLRIVTAVGFAIFAMSSCMAVYVVWHALYVGDTVPGWASTTLPIYFIGGVQLLCLGIVGEYVGQIFTSVKNRPRWICEDRLD